MPSIRHSHLVNKCTILNHHPNSNGDHYTNAVCNAYKHTTTQTNVKRNRFRTTPKDICTIPPNNYTRVDNYMRLTQIKLNEIYLPMLEKWLDVNIKQLIIDS